MRKIAIKLQDRPVDPGGPVEREHEGRIDGGVSLGRPMAAAASAAISMEMRWMSAISYDKISPQKRGCPVELGPPRYLFFGRANSSLENVYPSLSFPSSAPVERLSIVSEGKTSRNTPVF